MIKVEVNVPVRAAIRAAFFLSLGWILCFNTYRIEADASAAVLTLVAAIVLNIVVFFIDHIDFFAFGDAE